MDSIVRNFLQQVLGEIVVLDADSINSTLPLKLKDLKMREKNIQDLLDEDSFFPFDITDGRIGSLSLTPGFFWHPGGRRHGHCGQLELQPDEGHARGDGTVALGELLRLRGRQRWRPQQPHCPGLGTSTWRRQHAGPTAAAVEAAGLAAGGTSACASAILRGARPLGQAEQG